MSSLYQWEARSKAISRVSYVLREKLQEVLFEIRDPNLYLPAPSVDAYYHVSDSPTEMAQNHMVAVLIYDASERVFDTEEGRRRTSGPEGNVALTQWELGVSLVFRKGLYDATKPVIDDEGKVLTAKEADYLRSERYSGALVDVVEKYARKQGVITNIVPLRSRGSLIPSDMEYIGMGSALFQVSQNVVVPNPKYTL